MDGGGSTGWMASGWVSCRQESPRECTQEGTQGEMGEQGGHGAMVGMGTVSVQGNIQCRGPEVRMNLAPGSRTRNQL